MFPKLSCYVSNKQRGEAARTGGRGYQSYLCPLFPRAGKPVSTVEEVGWTDLWPPWMSPENLALTVIQTPTAQPITDRLTD